MHDDHSTDGSWSDKDEREYRIHRYDRINAALGFVEHVAEEPSLTRYATAERDGCTWHLVAVNTTHGPETMQKIINEAAGRWSGVRGRDENMRHVQALSPTE